MENDIWFEDVGNYKFNSPLWSAQQFRSVLDKEIKVALHHIVACQSQLKPIFPINYSLTQQTYYSI